MKIKIISDYRKLMAQRITRETAIDLAATSVVTVDKVENDVAYVRLPSLFFSYEIPRKVGKVTLWTEVK